MPQKGKSIEDISGGQIVLYQNNLEVKIDAQHGLANAKADVCAFR